MGSRHEVSPFSRLSLASIPRTVVASSEQAGWTSLLVERHVVRPHEDVVTLPPTPDRTVIVGLRGGQDLELHGPGGTRVQSYRAAAVGFTNAGEGLSLRRRPVDGAGSFEKINIYLPAGGVAELHETLRGAGKQVGWPSGGPRQDRELQAMALVVLRAAAHGASELYAEAAAQWIAVHLAERHGNIDVRSPTGYRYRDRRIAAAVELIDANFTLPITLDDLAAAARVSRFHFARLFTQTVGVPPHRYLVRKRVDLATRLLADTDLSLAEVARRCGFPRTASFCRAFTAVHDTDPAAYRLDARR